VLGNCLPQQSFRVRLQRYALRFGFYSKPLHDFWVKFKLDRDSLETPMSPLSFLFGKRVEFYAARRSLPERSLCRGYQESCPFFSYTKLCLVHPIERVGGPLG
jgi:hypothetical protein